MSPYIKHVIIIVQENRSFDNMFNGFPGADTVTVGQTKLGPQPLAPVPFVDGSLDNGHFHRSFTAAYDAGLMDDFNAEGTYTTVGCGYCPTPGPPNFAYSYLPQSETKPYWDLAKQFTLADRMFASNSGPSFPAHQYLIAGQSDDVAEVPNGPYWGCDDTPGSLAAQLAANGTETPGVFPCFDYPTLADSMDAAGVTWRYYVPQPLYIWNAYDAIRHIRYGSDWTRNVITPETTVFTDIANDNLAQVSWVVPQLTNSDHGLANSATGPPWVASIVDAVGASPYWNDTAILIVWDDWGGWYDHVPPPQLDVMGLGIPRAAARGVAVCATRLCVAHAARVRQHPPLHGGDLRIAVARHCRRARGRAPGLFRFHTARDAITTRRDLYEAGRFPTPAP